MLIEIENLNKSFVRGSRPLAAVAEVNLKLKKGEFAHIVGRSGSGKTTLLNLIAGLLRPDEGTVRVNDCDLLSFSKEQRATFRNRTIGYIPQRAVLLETLNAFENVLLPWYLAPREGDARGRAHYLFDKLGIQALKTSYPKELSGGELRRIQIARALMTDPLILLADEPTSDLDQATTHEVMELLKKLNGEGLSLLVVTHELETLSYGTTVYTMSEGRLHEGLSLDLPQLKGERTI